MKQHRWREISREQMNPLIARQVIHCDSITVARIFLAKGAVVPRHNHVNEQVTMLESGKLRFVFDDGEHIVEAGEVMQIPSNAWHLVEALEDSVATDLFCPTRADWIRGDDAYLRK